MAFIPGTDGIFSMDNESGVLTAYSNEVSKFSSDVDISNGEFATFGEGWQTTAGRRKYKASFSYYPKTGSSFHNMMQDYLYPGAGSAHVAKTIRFDMPNSSAGSFRIEGEFLPSSFKSANQESEGDGKPSMLDVPGNFTIEPSYTLLS